jgi:hypothetical protein
VPNVSSGSFNGKRLIIRAKFPASFDCSGDGCWVKIRYSGFTAAADTTTWSASMEGNPVRLVE